MLERHQISVRFILLLGQLQTGLEQGIIFRDRHVIASLEGWCCEC